MPVGVSSGQAAGGGVAPAAARADGGALQRGGADMHAAAPGQDELQHLRVQEPLHRLSVDVRDQVARPQARLEGGAAALHRLRQERTVSPEGAETRA